MSKLRRVKHPDILHKFIFHITIRSIDKTFYPALSSYFYLIYKFNTDIHEIEHQLYTAVCNDNMAGKDRKAPVEHS